MKRINLLGVVNILFFLSFFISSNAQESSQQINVDPLVDELLVLKNKMTEKNDFTNRYTIQLFYGSSREEAVKIRNRFHNKYDSIPTNIVYQSPNYKVWAGNYTNSLDAEKCFIELKEDFKSALLIRPKK
ncbi:hypothetical protein GGR32_001080 [Mesonia hippocampi]|uniref:SPOR domain-containing protein n=1 Tax=Mesonia hippocampi TaxID=1628250 RepID=A0A840EP93_9FLAO|nr:SPOR domain-containing protein [Mesonia hippocampi]MBB4118800.1 hypothetical protein [Mesonia hippocampi]